MKTNLKSFCNWAESNTNIHVVILKWFQHWWSATHTQDWHTLSPSLSFPDLVCLESLFLHYFPFAWLIRRQELFWNPVFLEASSMGSHMPLSTSGTFHFTVALITLYCMHCLLFLSLQAVMSETLYASTVVSL